MIGLDTNVLARYYVEDRGDAPALRQRTAARNLMESGRPLMVAKTVIMELEWVLRGFYAFQPAEVLGVLRHLCALPHVTIEDRLTVERALELLSSGFDLADALHHASYRACDGMVSFDDRRFARRARKLGLSPTVSVPAP